MKIRFTDYLDKHIEHNGFILKPRDAYDTAVNIEQIFLLNSSWFRRPKPMHYLVLREKYKKHVPMMEAMHPGVVDQMIQPPILRQLGFPVDEGGLVEYPLR